MYRWSQWRGLNLVVPFVTLTLASCILITFGARMCVVFFFCVSVSLCLQRPGDGRISQPRISIRYLSIQTTSGNPRKERSWTTVISRAKRVQYYVHLLVWRCQLLHLETPVYFILQCNSSIRSKSAARYVCRSAIGPAPRTCSAEATERTLMLPFNVP